MGCVSLCKIFEVFSIVMEWVVCNKLVIFNIIYILDDFFILEKFYEVCVVSFYWFLYFCEDIGVFMVFEKMEGFN